MGLNVNGIKYGPKPYNQKLLKGGGKFVLGHTFDEDSKDHGTFEYANIVLCERI